MITLDLDHDGAALGDRLRTLQTVGAVFTAVDAVDDWQAVEDRLVEAFELSRRCVERAEPLIFLVRASDVRGTRGPLPAALAHALLSAARTLAMEGARERFVVNVVAADGSIDTQEVCSVVAWLLDSRTVTGELIDLGTPKFGRLQS